MARNGPSFEVVETLFPEIVFHRSWYSSLEVPADEDSDAGISFLRWLGAVPELQVPRKPSSNLLLHSLFRERLVVDLGLVQAQNLWLR